MSDIKLWVVMFYHRHGESLFPVFQKEEPSEEQMIELAKEDNYEPDREDEWLECYGPFDVPTEEWPSKEQWENLLAEQAAEEALDAEAI